MEITPTKIYKNDDWWVGIDRKHDFDFHPRQTQPKGNSKSLSIS